MVRYWVIAPYDSRQGEIFDKAWEYDLREGTIAVGWSKLKNISDMTKPELKSKFEEIYSKEITRDINTLWRFFHEISPNDIIIARRGTKRIIGIGRVIAAAFYNVDDGKERVAHSTEKYYSNFIKVQWDKTEEIYFEQIVFSFYTMYEIDKEKYLSLIGEQPIEEASEELPEFILEKYLEEFIVSNFERIFRGQLELFLDDEGNIGQQYPTEVGNIDILAKDPTSNSYIVIELKKGRESDRVVGQILRYMGWVKENLCQENENVKGLIICGERDERLDYALRMVQNISLKFYSLDFELIDG